MKILVVDFVIEMDYFVEDLIIFELWERFFLYRFIVEEVVVFGVKCVFIYNLIWIIDFIDGICNFVYRFLIVVVSIGFVVW